MKKLTFSIGSLLLGGIILFTSCSKQGPTGPTGAQGVSGASGPILSGGITGHVTLYDEYGGQQFGNKSSVKVYLLNQNLAPIDSVNADSAGAYSIIGVQTGTYGMLFKATGYGFVQRNPAGFVGGGNTNIDAKMSQFPDFSITNITSDSIINAQSFVIIKCMVSSASIKQRTALVFIGKDSTVSPMPSTYLSVYQVNIPADTTSLVIKIPFAYVYNSILVKGTVPYFVVFSATNDWNTASVFEDLPSGKDIYTALGPPSRVTFPRTTLP